MFEWLSEERAFIAAFLVIALIISFGVSLTIGLKQSILRANDEVFGDPDRTKGGWYWSVCGASALLLIWFYFSWEVGRAYFPKAANEICQVAKIEESISPINAAMPIGSRYYKSTDLIIRNTAQLDSLEAALPVDLFSAQEASQLFSVINQTRQIIAAFSNPDSQDPQSQKAIANLAAEFDFLSEDVLAGYDGYEPTPEALLQPKWGITEVEIPLLPLTPRGVLFDNISLKAKSLADTFLKLRSKSAEADRLIAKTKAEIKTLKEANSQAQGYETYVKNREAYVKAVERIFKRVDDGTIFPPEALAPLYISVQNFTASVDDVKGGLGFIDSVFLPGNGIIKSRTQCTEQGPGRWLPKPTDVVATFTRLANPDVASGGGYKGTTLLWWKWLEISDVVDFFVPDSVIDMLPGSYGTHSADGTFEPTFKDNLLRLAKGKISLGAIPMLDGHIWDSLFRVLVAMGAGILFGVPLGIYMGVSRFFKSFFDPLIELYRPVPPLAWAPLILTIFGIQDDGKIFLLFMVAFAIMVISARTGASGTQLSKIRASHSLGATNQQILRYVILPNALPEILTGIRIAIGVCWGTLVAAEMLAGTTGVGFIENVARTVSDYELIWVTILIMGILGLLFDIMMRWVIQKTIPWRGKG